MSSALDIGAIQSGAGLDIGAIQSASASALTITQIDILTLSDSQLLCLNLFLIFSDAISLSDSIGIQYGNVTASDTFTFLDGVLVCLNYEYAFTDSLALGDSAIDIVVVIIQIMGDGLTLNDSIIVSPFAVDLLNLNDVFSFFDSYQGYISNPLIFGDQLLFQDSLMWASKNFYGLNDQLVLSDNVGMLLAPIRNLQPADALTLSDAITVTNNSIFVNLTISVGDSLLIGDGIAIVLEGDLFYFSESFFFGDSTPIIIIMSDLTPYLRRYLNDVVGVSNS